MQAVLQRTPAWINDEYLNWIQSSVENHAPDSIHSTFSGTLISCICTQSYEQRYPLIYRSEGNKHFVYVIDNSNFKRKQGRTTLNFESNAAGFLWIINFTASARMLSFPAVLEQSAHRQELVQTILAAKHWQYLGIRGKDVNWNKITYQILTISSILTSCSCSYHHPHYSGFVF